jgi:fumarate hydratase class II
LGEIDVPGDRYWGAQTQRSLQHFDIGEDRLPRPMIRALGLVKKAAALANAELGLLAPDKAAWIVAAADEVIAGRLDDHFPVRIWQTGSGTQSNMNANEVIANRAIELAGGRLGSKDPVHPHDHVNCGQSSNDVFPTAMHVAIAEQVGGRLRPRVEGLRATLAAKAVAFADLIKVGRTHLQDATPVTLGQEMDAFVAQLDHALAHIEATLPAVHELPLGGTAVGTGLGAHPRYAALAIARLAELTALPLRAASHRLALQAAHDPVVALHGALRVLAVALTKIANDIRWLASGPRAGLGEIRLPANEPGSSMMPGKVNPTQCEALIMVCVQVFGHDVAVTIAGAGGSFELNTGKPLIAHDVLASIRLLGDACERFDRFCAAGIEPEPGRLGHNVERSLMVVTALASRVGYERAVEVAHKAQADGLTVREAALALGIGSPDELDVWLDPRRMLAPDR